VIFLEFHANVALVQVEFLENIPKTKTRTKNTTTTTTRSFVQNVTIKDKTWLIA